MKQSIFAVEDDPSLQELYQYALENDFDCRCFNDGESFFAALEKARPDLVLLDIMLPKGDGFSVLSRLKMDRETSHIPVIMVSAKGEELSKVRGLTIGADDYITKPFGILEFVARVKAALRKNSKAAVSGISYKDITIDFSKHQVTVSGRHVATTLKEYNLLCLLCVNAEKIQEREVIFSEVWGENFIGETRTLDIHIKELRKKLSGAGSTAVIQTIRGVGYMII